MMATMNHSNSRKSVQDHKKPLVATVMQCTVSLVNQAGNNFLDFDSLAAPCLFQGLAWSSMTSQKASQNRYK